MNPITIRVEIPALDRLCALLESRNTAQSLTRPVLDAMAKPETASEPQSQPVQAAPEPPREEPAPAPEPAQEPAQPVPESPKAPAVNLDAVQRAAAQLRDEGKLKAVTDMFPEFGIRKLSDLKGDGLQKFADRLREMGAKL